MLTIYTIVLNGQPYIERHLEQFRKLPFPWQWRICEGVSAPVGCTSHCGNVSEKWSKNGHSIDGTTEYLDSIAGPQVAVVRNPVPYPGKLAMIEAALAGMNIDTEVVMEIDADEMWTAEQIEGVYRLMRARPPGMAAQFRCKFFVTPTKIITTREGFASAPYEWFRAWRWEYGVKFVSHEPPAVSPSNGYVGRDWTEELGLVFDHFAYCNEAQVRFKEEFYKWPGFFDRWKSLCQTPGPVQLNQFIGYADNQATADDIR